MNFGHRLTQDPARVSHDPGKSSSGWRKIGGHFSRPATGVAYQRDGGHASGGRGRLLRDFLLGQVIVVRHLSIAKAAIVVPATTKANLLSSENDSPIVPQPGC